MTARDIPDIGIKSMRAAPQVKRVGPPVPDAEDIIPWLFPHEGRGAGRGAASRFPQGGGKDGVHGGMTEGFA